MQGDDRKRFCGDCKLNVYNLSGMTRYDAEHLLRMSEGGLCIRYFKRPDGSVLTKDCPVGWAMVKQRVTIFAAAAFSLVLSLLGGIFILSFFSKKTPPRGGILMGAVAIATPTPRPTPPLESIVGRKAPPTIEQTPRPKPKKERKTLPIVRPRAV